MGTGHTISEKNKDIHYDIIRTGSDILTGTMMILGAIMPRRVIEPNIPRNIKTKRPCLTSLGTARDIKNENKSKTY